jgi:sugar lactone lactonase YvrE
MKPTSMLLCLPILIAGIGCKKGGLQETPSAGKKWVVTTIAGTGAASFVNGPALSATFHFPFDIAVAADGTMYVADILNNCIRKIGAGQVSTFAGGDFGIVNGNAHSAEFKYPYSIVTDPAGNVYATDVADPRIRKITSGAEVSTYAGADEEGFADGDADTAQFREETSLVADTEGNVYMAPSGIALDKQGNLYVADAGNYRIRKITPGGQVSSFAGSGISGHEDGDAGTARFDYPMDMVIDSAGNLYVLDISRIRKVSPQGVVSTIAGSTDGYADGDGVTAKFHTPAGLGIDAEGNIYVADTNNNRIRKISLQ